MQLEALNPELKLSAYNPKIGVQRPHLHSHAFYELGVVVCGRWQWMIQDRPVMKLTAGNFVLLPPATVHQERVQDTPRGAAWVGFTTEEPLEKSFPKSMFNRPLKDASLGLKIEGLIKSICEENTFKQTGSHELMKNYLNQILILLHRCAFPSHHSDPENPAGLNSRQLKNAQNAAFYFQRNLQNPLSVAQAARYFSQSTSHFSAMFRKCHGISPRKYIHESRMQHSKKLLMESNLTIKEIAVTCGFVDAAHFCRKFKTEFRKTPTQFRTSRS